MRGARDAPEPHIDATKKKERPILIFWYTPPPISLSGRIAGWVVVPLTRPWIRPWNPQARDALGDRAVSRIRSALNRQEGWRF